MTVGQALAVTDPHLPAVHPSSGLPSIPAPQIHGIIHCSGGGQAKIGKFGAIRDGKGNRYVKHNPLPVPPLFRLLQQSSGCSLKEAYTVWNMGARLEVILLKALAEQVVAIAQDCRIDAQISGAVEQAASAQHEVVVHGEGGVHHYTP